MACKGLNSLSGSHQREARALNLSSSAWSTLCLLLAAEVAVVFMGFPEMIRAPPCGALIVAFNAVGTTVTYYLRVPTISISTRRFRSEDHRVGQACVSPSRSRSPPYPYKKKPQPAKT